MGVSLLRRSSGDDGGLANQYRIVSRRTIGFLADRQQAVRGALSAERLRRQPRLRLPRASADPARRS